MLFFRLLFWFPASLFVSTLDLHLDLGKLLQILHLRLIEANHVIHESRLTALNDIFIGRFILIFWNRFFLHRWRFFLFLDLNWFAFTTVGTFYGDFFRWQACSTSWKLRNLGLVLLSKGFRLSSFRFSSRRRFNCKACLLNNFYWLIGFKTFYLFVATLWKRFQRR